MTTHWDAIYQNFQKGGEAWATLGEDIHPLFISFVESAQFPLKRALDIGCGDGKYLQFLQSRGFDVAGIDSSETAIRMSQAAVPDADIRLADMFMWEYPADAFDLVVSVSTIHHGFKPQIAAMIPKIHRALIDEGHVFITLPDMRKTEDWETFHYKDDLGGGTFAPLDGPEKGLPHSFYTEEEVRDLFADFRNLTLTVDEIGRWIMTGKR